MIDMVGIEGKNFNVLAEKMAYGGEAIGRLPDGRAVFIPFALPGERVRVRLVEEKRGYARAALLEVLSPSPQRIAPRCLHFTICGGCHYQHMPYSAQLELKASILRDQLARIGGIADPPVEPTIPSHEPWNYRNHIQFHVSPEGKIGYQASGSQEVIPILECHLPEGALNEIWPLLDLEPLPEIQRIGLRLGAGEEVLMVLESDLPQAPEIQIEGITVSAVHLSPSGMLILAGSDFLEFDVLGRSFHVSAGSFFQVNTPMAERMVHHILDNLELDHETELLEIYCGAGLFSAFLASRVRKLVGIESSPSACEDFVVNLDEFNNVDLYEAPVDQVLPSLDIHPDVILVDPPRAGLGDKVTREILRLQPSDLVYVSCDPATLARDARRLVEGGYCLRKITPFDLFPQTYHIESISFWKRQIPS